MELAEAIWIQDALESAHHGVDIDEFAAAFKVYKREQAREYYQQALNLAKNRGGYRNAMFYIEEMIEILGR